MLRIPALAGGAVLMCLAACETPPKSTLMPADVPVLYEAPLFTEISTDPCAGLREEIERLNTGLGETPLETAIIERSTLMQRLEGRAKSALLNELNNQLGGALDIVRMLTDQGETDRLLAEGKKRGMIRRAYVMGYMDASTCIDASESDIEVRVVKADVSETEEELVQQVAESAPPEDVLADVPQDQIISLELIIDYVVQTGPAATGAMLLNDQGYPIPAPSNLGVDGMWPPEDLLGYRGISPP